MMLLTFGHFEQFMNGYDADTVNNRHERQDTEGG